MDKQASKKSISLLWNIIGLFVVALVILDVIHWGLNKGGYHVDELISFQLVGEVRTASMRNPVDGSKYLNTWHSPEFYNDFFTINGSEAFDISGVWNQIKKDVHPPLFYILLEIANSVFCKEALNPWGGILINTILMILSLAVLQRIAYILTKSEAWSVIICGFYALGVGGISTVMFIRMYMLLTLASLLFFYINVKLFLNAKTDNETGTGFKVYAALFCSTILGMMSQYYFLIFAFYVCGLLSLFLIAKRKWKCFAKYVITMLASLGVYVLIWPQVIHDIFSGSRGTEAIDNFESGNMTSFMYNLRWELVNIRQQVLGNAWISLVVIVMILSAVKILIAVLQRNNGKKIEPNHFNVSDNDIIAFAMLLVTLCYVVTVSLIAPGPLDRYIMNIFPFVGTVLVYVFWKLGTVNRGKHIYAVVVAIFLTALLYKGYKEIGIRNLGTDIRYSKSITDRYSNCPAISVVSSNKRTYSLQGAFFYKDNPCSYVLSMKSEELTIEKTPMEADTYVVYLDRAIENPDEVLLQIDNKLGGLGDYEYLIYADIYDAYLLHVE